MAWVIGKSFGELSWSRMMPAIRRRSVSRTPSLRDVPKPPKRDLNDLIEGEIIPRLLMAHSPAKRPVPSSRDAAITPAEAERFWAMPITADTEAMMMEVDALLARGVSVESIFLDLLAPSARKLGKCWEDDVCDFVDVTLGLTRLHEVLREVALRSPAMVAQLAGPRHALFSPMPGDLHNFGTLMIEEMFSRAGWNAESMVCPTQKELLDRVAMQPLDLLGLTVSNDCSSRALKALITAVRGVSADSHIRILVGGRMINADPSVAQEAGADGTATDGKSALALADQLVVEARELLLS